MAILSALSKYSNFGLLILRIGLGAMMIAHGFPKLTGGPEMWTKLGSAMENLGMHHYPTLWGFMAAFAEAVGGLLFLIGFAFRPACLLLMFTMMVASISHISKGDGLMGASHAIELTFVFLGLIFVGPGAMSVDKK